MTPRLNSAIAELAAARLRLKNARMQLDSIEALATPSRRVALVREAFAAEDHIEKKMSEVLNAWAEEPK